MKHYVYILKSLKNESYYKGYTNDLPRRVEEHNKGITPSTSRFIPWKLEWSITLDSKAEAMKLERKLKNITSRKRVEEFIDKYSLK